MFSESLKTIILFLTLAALNSVKDRETKDRGRGKKYWESESESWITLHLLHGAVTTSTPVPLCPWGSLAAWMVATPSKASYCLGSTFIRRELFWGLLFLLGEQLTRHMRITVVWFVLGRSHLDHTTWWIRCWGLTFKLKGKRITTELLFASDFSDTVSHPRRLLPAESSKLLGPGWGVVAAGQQHLGFWSFRLTQLQVNSGSTVNVINSSLGNCFLNDLIL